MTEDTRTEGWTRPKCDLSCRCFRSGHKVKAGALIRVVPAYNQPQEGDAIRYWADIGFDDCYGIPLYDDDFDSVFNGNED